MKWRHARERRIIYLYSAESGTQCRKYIQLPTKPGIPPIVLGPKPTDPKIKPHLQLSLYEVIAVFVLSNAAIISLYAVSPIVIYTLSLQTCSLSSQTVLNVAVVAPTISHHIPTTCKTVWAYKLMKLFTMLNFHFANEHTQWHASFFLSPLSRLL